MRTGLIVLTAFLSLPAGASDIACDGDACDVLSPLMGQPMRFTDTKANPELQALLGGVSGVLIGNEIGDKPGAVGLGLLGAVLGYEMKPDPRWVKRQAQESRAAWQRGDDMYYNPAHPLPANPHYMKIFSGKRKD